MKKNKLLILSLSLFALSIITGCAKNKGPKTLVDLWQKENLIFNDTSDDSLIRSIASLEGQNKCLGDLMSPEFLKQEVQKYESFVKAKAVNGHWKHIDLSTLPVPQANFLIRFGDKIGDLSSPESIDYSNCLDLVCIFNKVYNKDNDDVAGYIHYIWYLKFGSYLSLDNSVYNQKSQIAGVYGDKQYPLSSYLYNENELYGLWRITHVMEAPYTSMQNFTEIQRIPRGAKLEGYDTACGLAYAGTNITLQDGCLTLDRNDRDKGFLYNGVMHELTHILDFSEARKKKLTEYYISDEKEYLDISGFYREEFTDEQGKLVYKWSTRPGSKFIRDYAATSPTENYAESLAVYRYQGDYTKSRITPEQYEWIGKNYFNSEDYDSENNMARYLEKYKSKHLSRIFFNVVSCSGQKQTSFSRFFSASDFSSVKMSPVMLNCLSFETESLIKKITAQVKLQEVEGCSTFKNTNAINAWNSELKKLMKNNITAYLNKMAKEPEFLNHLNSFKSSLESPKMANDAIYSCYDGNLNNDFSDCYERKLNDIVKQNLVDLSFPEGQVDVLVPVYTSSFLYKNVINNLILTFKSIVDSNNESIRIKSQELWDQCFESSHNDESKPQTNLYNPSNGYMVSSMLNCLNTNIPQTLTSILKEIEYSGVRLEHEKEELIMYEFITPKLIGILESAHAQASAQELLDIDAEFEKVSQSITDSLLADFSWVNELSDRRKMLTSCKSASLKQITYLPLFHLKRDVFGKLIETKVCSEVMNHKNYNQFIDSSNQELEEKVFSKIEILLFSKAKLRAESCLKSIPWKWERTKVTVRVPRKLCLLKGWSGIEEDIAAELLAMPEVKRFNVERSEIASRISRLKDKVKENIERQYF